MNLNKTSRIKATKFLNSVNPFYQPKNKLVSIHIPKTAGMAFNKILTSNYPSNLIFLDYKSRPCHNDFKVDILEDFSRVKRAEVIHGHFVAKRYKNLKNAQFIAWVRNPIDRLISHYYFVKTTPPNDGNKYTKLVSQEEMSFQDFAKLEVCQNFQSKFLEGIDIDQFLFLGITEKFAEDIQKLSQMLNWEQKTKIKKTNVNKTPNYQKLVMEIKEDSHLISMIKDLNKKDFDLYEKLIK